MNDDIQFRMDRLEKASLDKAVEWNLLLWSLGEDELAQVEQEFGMFRRDYGMVKVGSDYNFVHMPTYKGNE